MQDFKRITVAYGDGIGPEIMQSTLSILKEAIQKRCPEFLYMDLNNEKDGLWELKLRDEYL